MSIRNYEKVAKCILYNAKTDTYYVHFSAKVGVQAFPTLEDAKAYRDAVWAEKRKKKIEDAKRKVWEDDTIETLHEAKTVWPYFLMDYLGVKCEDYELGTALNTLAEREINIICYLFRDKMNLEQVARQYGMCRERVRQIASIALRKVANEISMMPMRKELAIREKYEEKSLQDLMERRKELVEEFKKTHEYTADMEVAFGKCNLLPNHAEPSIYDMDIREMGLSIRTENCLKRAGMSTVGDVCKKTRDELMQVRNLGKKSLREVKSWLASHGLALETPSHGDCSSV